MKISFLKIYIKIKDFLFFLLLILVQIIAVFLTNLLSNKILFLKDPLSTITIQYLSFFIILFIIWKKNKKNLSFISNEDWFISLEKSLIPAIIAFGVAFLSIMLFISIVEFLPLPVFIKEWIKIPNQGFVELFDNIENNAKYKVIIWFFYIIIIAPIVEEIVFRGFLMESLSKIFKKFNIDVILTSIIFAIFHISSLSNALYSLIIGIFLSKQRKHYKYINSCIWIHGLINFTGVLFGILLKYYYSKLNL